MLKFNIKFQFLKMIIWFEVRDITFSKISIYNLKTKPNFYDKKVYFLCKAWFKVDHNRICAKFSQFGEWNKTIWHHKTETYAVATYMVVLNVCGCYNEWQKKTIWARALMCELFVSTSVRSVPWNMFWLLRTHFQFEIKQKNFKFYSLISKYRLHLKNTRRSFKSTSVSFCRLYLKKINNYSY